MPDAGSGIREHDLREDLTRRLQDRYEIRPQEAAKAVADFVGSRTRPIRVLADESMLEGAAFAAFSLWTGMTDPRVVAVREQMERVTGLEEGITAAETSWEISEPGDPGGLLRSYRDLEDARATLTDLVAAQQHGIREADPTLHNTAYLGGAAAALAELAAAEHSGQPSRSGHQVWSTREAATDLATAESAITLLREDRDRRGYTAEDAATARALRTVLDGARVWDQVSSPVTAEPPQRLEEGLRPDRVRSHPVSDDSVVLEAAFAGVTIRVQRTGDGPASGEYRFLATEHGATGPLIEVDPGSLGVIAAGDRTPRPDRQSVYRELGEQVRDHLIGLARVVSSQRDALHRRETQRLDAALHSADVQVSTGPERPL